MLKINNTISLGTWLLRWVNIYIRPARKPKTTENYLFVIDVLRRNIPCLFDSNINSLVELNFQDGINFLSDRYSKSVCKTLRSVLKRAYASAIRNKICSYAQNPAANLVIPADAHEEQIYAFNVDEEKAIRQAASTVFQGHLAIFLLDTGLRCCELSALCWSDYNSEKHTIRIRESKTKAGRRIIPLIPEAEHIILNQPHCNEFIFTSRIGTPISKTVMHKLCTRLEEASGVKQIRPHRFRHTFATRLVELGVDYKALSTLMGHTSVAFTMARYVNVEVDFLRDQINLLSPLSGKTEVVSNTIHTKSKIEKADCLCLYTEKGEPVPLQTAKAIQKGGTSFPCSIGESNPKGKPVPPAQRASTIQKGNQFPYQPGTATPKGNQFPLLHGRKQLKRGTSSPAQRSKATPKGNQFPRLNGRAQSKRGTSSPTNRGQQPQRGTSSPCSTGESNSKGEPVPLLNGRKQPQRGTSSPCSTGESNSKGEPVPPPTGDSNPKGEPVPLPTGDSNPKGEPVPLPTGDSNPKGEPVPLAPQAKATPKGNQFPCQPRTATPKGNQFPLLHGRKQLQRGTSSPANRGQQSQRGTSSPAQRSKATPKGNQFPLLNGQQHSKRGTSSPCLTGGSNPEGEPVPLLNGRKQPQGGTSFPC